MQSSVQLNLFTRVIGFRSKAPSTTTSLTYKRAENERMRKKALKLNIDRTRQKRLTSTVWESRVNVPHASAERKVGSPSKSRWGFTECDPTEKDRSDKL